MCRSREGDSQTGTAHITDRTAQFCHCSGTHVDSWRQNDPMDTLTTNKNSDNWSIKRHFLCLVGHILELIQVKPVTYLSEGGMRQFGLVVTSLGVSMKLLYVEPG